jgi:hypothetical protein
MDNVQKHNNCINFNVLLHTSAYLWDCQLSVTLKTEPHAPQSSLVVSRWNSERSDVTRQKSHLSRSEC